MKKNKQAVILLFVFFVILSIASIYMSFLSHHLSDHRLYSQHSNQIKANWLSKGGLQLALSKLKYKPETRGQMTIINNEKQSLKVSIKKPNIHHMVIESNAHVHQSEAKFTKKISPAS